MTLSSSGYNPGDYAAHFTSSGLDLEEASQSPFDRAIASMKDDPNFQTNLVAAMAQQGGDVYKAKVAAITRTSEQAARKQALMDGTTGGLSSIPQANAYLNDSVQQELSVANFYTSKGTLFTTDQVNQRRLIHSGQAAQIRASISANYGSDNAARTEALKIFDEAEAGRMRIFDEIGALAEKDLEVATKEYYINAASGLISASTKGLTHTDAAGNETIIPNSVARLALSAYRQMSINDNKMGLTPLQKEGYDTMLKLMELVPEPSVAMKWGYDSDLQKDTKEPPKEMFDDTKVPSGSDVKKTIDGLDKLTNEFKGMENNPEARHMTFLTAGQSAGVVAKMNGVLSAKDTQALAMSGYKKIAQDMGRTDPSQGRALTLRWKEAHKAQTQRANRAMADLGVGLFDGDGNIKSDGLLSAASEAVSRMNGQEKLSAENLLQTLDQVANEAYGGDKLAAIEDRGKAFGRLGTEERRFFAVLNSEEFFGDSRIEKYKGFRNARDAHKVLMDSWDSDLKSYDKKEDVVTDPIFGSFGEEPLGVRDFSRGRVEREPIGNDFSLLDSIGDQISIGLPNLENLKEKDDLIGLAARGVGALSAKPKERESLGSQVDAITSSGASREEQLSQLRALVESRYSSEDTTNTDTNVSFVGLEGLSRKKDLIGVVSGALNWIADQVVSPAGAATLTEKGATNIEGVRTLLKEAGYPGDAAAIAAISKVESGGKWNKVENARYSPERLVQLKGAFSTLKGKTDDEVRAIANKGPEAALNYMYAYKIGNGGPASGDGYKFRGRGYIQLTGKANYKEIGDEIGVDLVANPDLLVQDAGVANAALLAFLKKRGNPKDIEAALKAVQGLREGWPEKRQIYKQLTTLRPPPRPEGNPPSMEQ